MALTAEEALQTGDCGGHRIGSKALVALLQSYFYLKALNVERMMNDDFRNSFYFILAFFSQYKICENTEKVDNILMLNYFILFMYHFKII